LKKELLESLKERARDVKEAARATAQRMAEARVPIRGPAPGSETSKSPLVQTERGGVPQIDEEPPVVARMIVEIRSDGTRTIARGALEDVVTGERVAIDAKGGSPIQLAASLAQSLLSTPFSLSRAAGALVRNRLGRGGDKR
jgi:hypothetical protein